MPEHHDLSDRVDLGDLLTSEIYADDIVAGRATDRLGKLLHRWRTDIHADLPPLISTDDAVAAILGTRAAARRNRRRLYAAPVAAAAALVALLGGTALTAYSAHPDSALWPVTETLYGEHSRSVAAAYRVEAHIAAAKQALATGHTALAERELAAAADDLLAVRPADGAAQLADVHDFLTAKAQETPEGQAVDPAAPLRLDPARPVPAGAALGAPVVLQVAVAPLLSPTAEPGGAPAGLGPVVAVPSGSVPSAPAPVTDSSGSGSPAPPAHSAPPVEVAVATGGGSVEVSVGAPSSPTSSSPAPAPVQLPPVVIDIPLPVQLPPILDDGRTTTRPAEPTTTELTTTEPTTGTAPPSEDDRAGRLDEVVPVLPEVTLTPVLPLPELDQSSGGVGISGGHTEPTMPDSGSDVAVDSSTTTQSSASTSAESDASTGG